MRPARGEDKDGNGVVNEAPEYFSDLNGNGVWDEFNAEPYIQKPPSDTTGDTLWVDFNRDGRRDDFEPFICAHRCPLSHPLTPTSSLRRRRRAV